ncbi:hypothetical protein [Paucibacter soli]|uniref:hypothetical protein n=1 Tax=Paucibacter soli TaxID=3133433 RepID=UPI0030A75915
MHINIAGLRYGATLLGAALAGCGGVADDIAKPIADAYVCAFTNCKESDSLALEDISPSFVVSRAAGQLRVEAGFGYRANLLTQVRLSSSDRLSAIVDGQRHDFSSTDDSRANWVAQFPANGATPSVQLTLERGTRTLTSSVQLPQLALLSTAQSVTLTRSSGGYVVQLSSGDSAHLGARVEGECSRVDGSRFKLTGDAIAYSPQGSGAGGAWAYRVDSAQLDSRLNELSRQNNKQDPATSPVASCQLSVNWVLDQPGQLDPGFSSHGRIVGRAQVSQGLSYLAS